MAIAARGHEAGHGPGTPDWLIAGRVRVDRVDFERDQLPVRRRTLALHERRLAADELALVPGDPAVHAGHARGIGLGELGRPDAETLFEPERQEGVVAIFPDAKLAPRLEQRPAQARG